MVLGLGAFFLAASAFGQGITTGTVSGSVTDPSGAVVPGASIQLTNQSNGLKLAAKSKGDGSFNFFAVPIGTYSAQITASGFSNKNVANVQVASGAPTNLNEVKLQVSTAAAQVVEVNGSAAALLETSDSQVTTTFSTQSMQMLPLNNGFDTVGELIPGRVGVTTTSRLTANPTTITTLPGRRFSLEARMPFSSSRSSRMITVRSMAVTRVRSRITSLSPGPTHSTAALSIFIRVSSSARCRTRRRTRSLVIALPG